MKSASAFQAKAQHLLANPWLKALTTALLISGGSLGLVAPALANGTTAGTEIKNTAAGSFQNPNDTAAPTTTVTSNEVTVTVTEVAGITAQGTSPTTDAGSGVSGAGPTQGNGMINPEDVVYFEYTITNVGNDPTQFFIPGAPSNILVNGSGVGGSLQGQIEIIGYDPDGTGGAAPVDLSGSPVAVPASGIATGDSTALDSTNGSFAPGGSVTVRVPIKLADANTLSTGDVVRVVLGDTGPNDNSAATQNQVFSAGSNDLYTQDNPDSATGETNGNPVNGDATNNRQEASAFAEVTINGAPQDFGDLPDGGAGTSTGDYETEGANGGPSHFINTTTFLGTAPTADSATNVSTFAGQTDASGDANDDGVTITSDTIATATGLQGQEMIQGQQITLEVTTSGDGNLQGWFDWNQDGDFDDPGEQIIAEVAKTGNGTTTTATFNVPADATPGDTFAMFRYSEDSGVGTTGVGGYGEVETFQVTVVGSAPELALVKRVTNIRTPDGAGGFTDAPETGIVNDNVANSADDEANWPANHLQGSIGSSKAAPGDQIEYSLYFLSSGNDDITNLNICDMIPANTSFVPGSISLEFNGATTAPGGFFAGAPTTPSICPTDNGKGGILVNVVTSPATLPNATAPGTPGNSFGTLKFRVTVD